MAPHWVLFTSSRYSRIRTQHVLFVKHTCVGCATSPPCVTAASGAPSTDLYSSKTFVLRLSSSTVSLWNGIRSWTCTCEDALSTCAAILCRKSLGPKIKLLCVMTLFWANNIKYTWLYNNKNRSYVTCKESYQKTFPCSECGMFIRMSQTALK